MSATTGWIDTARRVVPAFFTLSRHTAPTWTRESVADLDPSALAAEGVRALIWDVDGTLMSHHAREVDPAVRPQFEALLRDSRFRHAIVSNCRLPRFRELGEMFPEVPVILGFSTPDGPAYRVLEGGRESRSGPGRLHLPEPGAEGGSDGVRPIRKPSAELVEEALRRLDLTDAREGAVMVGDQHFTDIASANLAGIRSVKIKTLDRPSFPLAVRLSQRFEACWVGALRALGVIGRHD